MRAGVGPGEAWKRRLIIRLRNPFDQMSTGFLSDSYATSSSRLSFVPLQKGQPSSKAGVIVGGFTRNFDSFLKYSHNVDQS